MDKCIAQELLVFQNGERFPILLGDDGKPLFYPNLYIVVSKRSANVAAKTLAQTERAIMLLVQWAMLEGFDIHQRFKTGQFLVLHEIESLANAASMYYADLYDTEYSNKKVHRVVGSSLIYTRLSYIFKYLDWLAKLHNKKLLDSEQLNHFEFLRTQMLEHIKSRRPSVNNKSINPRIGLTETCELIMCEAVIPEGEKNPWKSYEVQFRNQLIVLLLLKLGIRVGELLSIECADIDFNQNNIFIRRYPDNLKDPRKYEPNTKTRDRKLPLNSELIELLNKYIIEIRPKNIKVRQHGFLIVAMNTGMPLSQSSVTKIFKNLSKKTENLPDNTSPHILRHTWNDRFSEVCEKNEISEEEEKKMRSYLMGWSEVSESASKYTKRYVSRKAYQASLDLQNSIGEV